MTLLVTADAHSDLDRSFLGGLTRSAEKAEHYRIDPYFRLGAQHVRAEQAHAYTFLVLKPDAVAGRRCEPALDAIRAHGFDLSAVHLVTFTPLLTREIWRYQFNIASWDRADVVDLLLPANASLLVVLKDRLWQPGGLPASCRLASLKGAADPGSRGPNSLRTLLSGPTTLFNFLHTADEPADVVRELALFGLAGGHSEALPLENGPAEDVELRLREALDGLYTACPSHDLDAGASLRRLGAHRNPAVAAEARAQLDGDGSGGWRALAAAAGTAVPADMLWDLLAVATAEIDCNVPGLSPVLPTVPASLWQTSD
ncbi:nucleoside-diphosphate kinase [Kitasatospora phosalacinea]|uniref:nucleoside-diphosphate kinase n=1 Tax=Kitasatospora phosalacinea TaxID=2065 RepID=UPI0035D9F88B